MLGDRYTRHSAIVEVESDTDNNIEQRQAAAEERSLYVTPLLYAQYPQRDQ